MAVVSAPCAAFAHSVRFVAIDPATQMPVRDATVTIRSASGTRVPIVVRSGEAVELASWQVVADADRTVLVPIGQAQAVRQQEPPVKEIYVTVSAARLKRAATQVSGGTTRTQEDISKFAGGNGDVKQVTKTTAGVAEDSAGQVHVRGEHTELTYVIDGVPLPDTLSGRSGSIVVPSTIRSVDVLLGGFAPEFGGQTAAVFDITTLPRASKQATDGSIEYGTFRTANMNVTAVGPLGSKYSYVFNFGAGRTDAAAEPTQPNFATAHNQGSDTTAYGKLTMQASSKDRLSLTMSGNPAQTQIGNRTGLPLSYAGSGQGYGFQGLRNADGTRPDATPGTIGSEVIPLPSQEQAGMDIRQRESNDFALLAWRRQISDATVGQFGLVFLHSGQQVFNSNPSVNMLALPIDSSIEFNPTVSRDVRHLQLNGNLTTKRGSHSFKVGVLFDHQSGSESYQLIPASQLALDALFATAPNLAPPGTVTGDVDVNGNPVYLATSNNAPTLQVDRSGYYAAAFAQDTWKITPRWTLNYGLRFDAFRQSQNLGQPTVEKTLLSPRINASYVLDRRTIVRGSFNKLFNSPPLAQGAILGSPLQPPIVDQYDINIERQVASNQSVKLAYYAKQIKNQIDVGLLIPGSQIGIYTGVNLERGGVHGVEFSYEISSSKGQGWDAYFNYTLSAAKPNGVDNTGAPVEEFNDHDQRTSVGVGVAYTAKSGASAALTMQYGSGLASSVVPPSQDRTPRTEFNLRLYTGDRLFKGAGGLGVEVLNVFDTRTVINYQSAFSGTRFQLGRRIIFSASFKF